MKDECGGVSNSSIFCSYILAFPIVLHEASVQRSALCICMLRTGEVFLFFLFRSHRPRNALYLVTFIVPEFPQTFNSVIFLFPSFNKQQ